MQRSKSRSIWHIACVGIVKHAYQVLISKNERRRLLWRPRHRWKGNIEDILKNEDR
jgi:hypothetical protein